MKSFLSLIFLILIFFSGCTTMYFYNGKQSEGFNGVSNEDSEMHINMFFSLAEVSDPVVLEEKCSVDWGYVKVERTFGDVLLGGLDQLFTSIDIIDFQTVSHTCSPVKRTHNIKSKVEQDLKFKELEIKQKELELKLKQMEFQSK